MSSNDMINNGYSNKAFDTKDEIKDYNPETIGYCDEITGRLDAGLIPRPYYRKKNRYKDALKQLKLIRPLGTKDRKEFPISTCGLVSFISSSWLTSVLWKIYKKGLDSIEPWYLSSRDCSHTNADRLDFLWNEEVAKEGLEKASLARVVFKFMRTRTIVNVLCLTVTMLSLFLGPAVVFKYLLEYKMKKEQPIGEGLMLVAFLLLTECFKAWLGSLCWNIGAVTGLRLRGAIICWLLRKVLKIRSLGDKSVGQIVNICINDGNAIFEASVVGVYITAAPIAGLITLGFSYNLIQYWSLLGVGVFITILPLQSAIGRLTAYFRRKGMQLTDRRVTLMNEVLTHIKLIKMYSWENSMAESVMAIRNKEAKIMGFTNFIQSISVAIMPFMATISSTAALLGYLLMENKFSSTVAFSVSTIFASTRMSLSILPIAIRGVAEVNVASKRFANIIKREEILKVESQLNTSFAIELKQANFSWDATSGNLDNQDSASLNNIKIETLSNQSDPPMKKVPSSQSLQSMTSNYLTLKDINMRIMKGKLIGVCGSVGSGKSSLLSGILGELKIIDGSIGISGSIAYVPQQAWLFNETLRENILFGLEFETNKYSRVTYAAGLIPDFELLAHGDKTEVVERGGNLSGGQKQRVSLARAFYSGRDIFLLDDPLSAVDTRVGRHIFKKGLTTFLKGKTVILVTHQLQYLKDCDYVYFMKHGRISEEGIHSKLLENQGEYSVLFNSHEQRESSEDKKQRADSDLPPDAAIAEGLPLAEADKLVQVEDKASGKVTLANYVSYAKAVGPILLFFTLTTYLLFGAAAAFNNVWLTVLIRQVELVLNRTAYSFSNYSMTSTSTLNTFETTGTLETTYQTSSITNWLSTSTPTELINSTSELINSTFSSISSSDNDLFYDNINTESSSGSDGGEWRIYHDEKTKIFIIIYGGAIIGTFLVGLIKCAFVSLSAYQASTKFHDKMFRKVIRSPMLFFDSNPIGRIINRFSKDIEEVDTRLPLLLDMFLHGIINCVYPLVLIAFTFPYFLLVIPPLFIAAMYLDKIFQVGIRDTKRLENITRSPVVSNLTATVEGISSIRCYQKENDVIKRFEDIVDTNSIPLVMFNFEMRWLAVRLEAISIFIVLCTALIIVLVKEIDSPSAGLALSSALQINVLFQFTVRIKAETEARFTSVERLQDYIKTLISESSDVNPHSKPPSSWPAFGKIQFDNVQMRYRDGLPLVLKGINFEIKAGEKIGIVGRTGSGKSSMAVALFRLAELSAGRILIDDIDISKIGLSNLRSRLSVIPQDPVLFSGTIRYNLDPFNEYTDEQLWIALEGAHLRDHIEFEIGTQKLDSNVETGGGNFSVGQRQLICLARALLRNSKILVLDEATASVDTETDSLIQKTIREQFSDYTLLIIAHRLNTVLFCDKIMVMDAGQIVEFDTPDVLRETENSIFKAMLSGTNPPDPIKKSPVVAPVYVSPVSFPMQRSISVISQACSEVVYHL